MTGNTRMPRPAGPESCRRRGSASSARRSSGKVLADGGLEVRPRMVRVLARFSSDDYQEFDGSYGRASRWARRHDKSALVNYVAPSPTELENELELVDQWFKRVRRYKDT